MDEWGAAKGFIFIGRTLPMGGGAKTLASTSAMHSRKSEPFEADCVATDLRVQPT